LGIAALRPQAAKVTFQLVFLVDHRFLAFTPFFMVCFNPLTNQHGLPISTTTLVTYIPLLPINSYAVGSIPPSRSVDEPSQNTIYVNTEFLPGTDMSDCDNAKEVEPVPVFYTEDELEESVVSYLEDFSATPSWLSFSELFSQSTSTVLGDSDTLMTDISDELSSSSTSGDSSDSDSSAPTDDHQNLMVKPG